jgi:hypothetical protein
VSASSAVPDGLDELAQLVGEASLQHRDVARRLERAFEGIGRPDGLLDAVAGLRRTAVRLEGLAAEAARTAGAFRAADRLLIGLGIIDFGGSGWRDDPDGPQWRWHRTVRKPLVEHRVPVIGKRTPTLTEVLWDRGRLGDDVEWVVRFGSIGTARARGEHARVSRGDRAANVVAGARLGDEAALRGQLGIQGSRLTATGTAGYAIGASAYTGASARVGVVGADARAQAFVGATARTTATVGVGRSGAVAGIEADALLGGEVVGSVSAGAAGVKGKAHAGVSYGVGAEMEATASFGADRVGVRLDLGITLGLGLEGGLELSIEPLEVGAQALNGAKAVGRNAAGLVRKVTGR